MFYLLFKKWPLGMLLKMIMSCRPCLRFSKQKKLKHFLLFVLSSKSRKIFDERKDGNLRVSPVSYSETDSSITLLHCQTEHPTRGFNRLELELNLYYYTIISFDRQEKLFRQLVPSLRRSDYYSLHRSFHIEVLMKMFSLSDQDYTF